MDLICDLLITNAVVLADPGLLPPIAQGFVAINGGTIRAVDAMTELPVAFRARQIIDARGGMVMPGLVNGHCHAAMTLFRGLADDLPLMEWLHQHIFPAEARFVSPEMVYWCSKLAAAEMILSGTTTVADSYFYEDEAVRAFHETGIRAVAAQGIIDFPAPGVPDPSTNITAAAAFLEHFHGITRIQPAIFCHSPYTCSAATLIKAKDLARRHGCRLFIHLAETRAEVEQIHAQHGISPTQHLKRLGLLDQETVAVHAVHLEADDIAVLKETGAGVITCPESNMKLASGIAPIPGLIQARIPVGLGSDGCASNNDLDLFGEMSTLAKLHKAATLDPTVLPARQAIRLATGGGAAVLGLGERIGRLAPGFAADCIILDLNAPHLTPFYSPDLLVYAARASDVRTVIIDGKVVLEERRLLSFDLAEAMAQVKKLAMEITT